MRKATLWISLIVGLTVLMAACGSDPTATPQPTNTPLPANEPTPTPDPFDAEWAELIAAAQAEGTRASSPTYEAEHAGWRDVYQLMGCLQIAATACVRIESADEPTTAEAEYTRLQKIDDDMRKKLEYDKLDIAKLTLSVGDEEFELEPEPDAQPAQAQLPAAVQQARDELQAVPMEQWSEEQVIAWAGMLGLPPASVAAAQEALGNGEIDGEELQLLLPKRFVKLLNKVQSLGAVDAASLADQVLEQRNTLQASASSEPSPRLR